MPRIVVGLLLFIAATLLGILNKKNPVDGDSSGIVMQVQQCATIGASLFSAAMGSTGTWFILRRPREDF